jgi:hypothetical protein
LPARLHHQQHRTIYSTAQQGTLPSPSAVIQLDSHDQHSRCLHHRAAACL